MALEAVTITPDTDEFVMTVGAGQEFTADLDLTGCYVMTMAGDIEDPTTVITAKYGNEATSFSKVTQFTWYNLYTSAIVVDKSDEPDKSDTKITFASNSATAVELTVYLMPLDTADSAVLALGETSVTVEGFSFVPYTIADADAYTITVTTSNVEYLMVIGPTYEIVRSVAGEEVTFTFTTPADNSLIIFGNKDFANNTFGIYLA